METDILDVMKKRRSIRKFRDEKPAPEVLHKVLKAGLLAPSSKNKRPVEYIVVQDRGTIEKLNGCKNSGTVGLHTAPCVIAVIADREKSDVWVEDASIAAIMLQLEAESLGLGSVWIQMRNRQSNAGDSEKEVREVLNIPEKYGVLCLLAIGYKDERKEPYMEEEMDFTVVHSERYES